MEDLKRKRWSILEESSLWTQRCFELNSAKIADELVRLGFPRRSPNAVAHKLSRLKWNFQRIRFSEDELNLLEYLYSTGHSYAKIKRGLRQKGFPKTRERSSLVRRVNQSGFKRLPDATEGKPWDEKEYGMLVAGLLQRKSISEMSLILEEMGYVRRSFLDIVSKLIVENQWKGRRDGEFWQTW